MPTFRRTLRNLRGFDPSESQHKEHGCCRALCVGDPYGRIVQVISLREITCCSCGEALLSPNVPPTISQGIPYVALFATCGGSIPPDRKKRARLLPCSFCGEVTDAMSELFFMDSNSSEVGMVIGVSSKVRNTLK